MADKNTTKLVKALRKQGWRVDLLKNGHYRAYAPDGETVIHFSGTPSDHRSLANTIALLRKAGYKE